MIKMTYGQLNQLLGSQGLLMKIFNTPMRAQLSYRFKKIFDDLGLMGKEIGKEHDAFEETLRPDFVQKNEKGEYVKTPLKDDAGNAIEGQFVEGSFELIEGKEKEYSEKKRSFFEKEFTIDRDALSLDDYSNTDLKFSLAEMNLLEPVFTPYVPAKDGEPQDNVKKLRA